MKKIFLYLLIIISFKSFASTNNISPLNKAFSAKVTNKDQTLIIEFNIQPSYYLYKNKFQIQTNPKINLKTPIFSKAQIYNDEFFGEQKIYKNYLKIEVPYQSKENSFNLNVQYQGCSEKGICYKTSNYNFLIKNNGIYYPIYHTKKINKNNNYNNFWNYLISLITFFITGIGLSFTACMYPIIPIISSIILGNNKINKKKSFVLSLSYVEGIAISYAIMGLIASLTGNLLNIFLQKPIFIFISDIIILMLSLSMFGFFNIQMPVKIQNYLNNKTTKIKGGKIFSVFIMGIISSLIIGPCIAPALAFILGYIATNKNYLLGTLYLYSLATGMGVPIIILCVFGIKFLPKSGKWIEYIKLFFGYILLFICVYITKPFLPYKVILLVYFILFISYAITLIYYSKFFNKIFKILSIILAILIIIYSLYFLILGINSKKTYIHKILILNPKKSTQTNVFTNEKELNNAIQKAFLDNPDEPIYIEFYAKWCINCEKMEMLTLNDEYVQKNINMKRFFKIDITTYSTEQKKLLNKYNLFGPPAIFMVKKYNRISEPLIGFVKPKELIKWVNKNK